MITGAFDREGQSAEKKNSGGGIQEAECAEESGAG
jgi:hypothetical protein